MIVQQARIILSAMRRAEQEAKDSGKGKRGFVPFRTLAKMWASISVRLDPNDWAMVLREELHSLPLVSPSLNRDLQARYAAGGGR